MKQVKSLFLSPVNFAKSDSLQYILPQDPSVCKQNYITVVSISPNTSHRIQSLDLTFITSQGCPFKRVRHFMTHNAHRKS